MPNQHTKRQQPRAIQRAVQAAQDEAVKHRSELEVELARLNQAGNALSLTFGDLMSRLDPVLIPVSKDSNNNVASEPSPFTQVGGVIRSEAYRLEALIQGMQSVIDRLGI